MSGLEFQDLRRCPVCERAVRGDHCPVDGSLTADEAALFAEDELVGRTVLDGVFVESRVPGGGGGALYAVRSESADDASDAGRVVVEIDDATEPRRAYLRLPAITEEEYFGVAERFAKVYSTLFSAPAHPALPAVTKYGREPDLGLFILSGRAEGRSLDALLAEERHLSSERAVAIALRLVDGLEALHEQGVVHRDLCAFRVRVHDELDAGGDVEELHVSLTDAGLFDVLAGRPGLAQPTDGGKHFADPRCMSPEIAAGYSADPRSDIYSLGVLLAVMLVGRYPFDGGDPVDVIRAHIREPFPEAILAPLPEDLKRLVLKMCAKSPDDRFQTASEVKSALHDFLDLFRMIGHDTDPELLAVTVPQAADDEWGELVTIGGDDDEGGGAAQGAPVLDSPSVMLDTSNTTALVERAVPGSVDGKSNALVGVALTLFLVVIALVAYPFLTEKPQSSEPEVGTKIATLTTVASRPDVRAQLIEDSTAAPTAKAEAAVAVKAPAKSPVPVANPAGLPAAGKSAALATDGAVEDVPDGQPLPLEIRSIPPRAKVLRNGYVIGETPMQLSLQSRNSFMIQLKKPGFMASAVEVLPGEQSVVEVRLKPLERNPAVKKRGLVSSKKAAAKPAAKAVKPAATVTKPAAKAAPTKATSVKVPKKKSSPKKTTKKAATKKTPEKKPPAKKAGGGDYDLF
jgi:hypothetical protein